MADTLRSICAQCPHLNSPQLSFFSGQQQRIAAIVARDLREIVTAASAELEKAVVVLAGSVIEALLHALIQSRESYIAGRRGAFQFDPEMGLRGYADLSNRWLRDVLPGAQIPDQVVRYRDLVHPNRELNGAPDACGLAAREMLRTLDLLLKELSELPPSASR
jgi:hypothetical protein